MFTQVRKESLHGLVCRQIPAIRNLKCLRVNSRGLASIYLPALYPTGTSPPLLAFPFPGSCTDRRRTPSYSEFLPRDSERTLLRVERLESRSKLLSLSHQPA